MNAIKTWVLVLCLVSPACVAASPDPQVQFPAAVRTLAQELTIPGIAFAVVRDGKVIGQGELSTGSASAPLTADTPLRFASVTKALTAIALMRAVDRGALSLDDPVSKWLPDFADRPEITIRHLAAHVSEGVPGAEYVYATQRYAKLGPVLAKALKAPGFEAVLRAEVIAPARMTWHESPDLGAHAALVSTVNDMARLVQALQRGTLLNRGRFEQMTTPFGSSKGRSPVGVGFFSQQIGGERVVWSFGQDDPDYSARCCSCCPSGSWRS